MYTYKDITALSGFQCLNLNQQRVIWDSLEIQKLADEGETKAVKFVNEWFCHAGIVALEKGGFLPDIIQKNCYGGIPHSFTDVEGSALFNVCSPIPLQKEISRHQPRVLHILKQHPGFYRVYHSVLFLGVDGQGKYITWEKQAAEKPFRVSNLGELVSEFSGFGWGSRSIKTYPSTEKNRLYNGS